METNLLAENTKIAYLFGKGHGIPRSLLDFQYSKHTKFGDSRLFVCDQKTIPPRADQPPNILSAQIGELDKSPQKSSN